MDLHCVSDIEEFYVEVERCLPTRWPDDREDLSFNTIHVLERRARYDRNVIIFCCRRDVMRARAVFWPSITESRLKAARNKFMGIGDGERIFDIPKDETLLLDLSAPLPKPLAVLNAERVRAICSNGAGREQQLLALGEVAPYGMSAEERRALLDKAEAHIESLYVAQVPTCSHGNGKFWVRNPPPDRYGRNCETITCSKCGGFVGYGGHLK